MAYVVMLEYQATEKNTNFYGKDGATQVFFFGKKYFNLNTKNHCETVEADAQEIPQGFIDEYGFRTKQSALKGLKAHQEQADFEMKNFGYWNITCKTVEV